MSRPSVSVVVNTYNRASSLPDTLRGLQLLNYLNFEIVVVNGPSTDGTDSILEQWKGPIKVAHCSVANLSVSRNVGIEQCSGDIVAFIDDDAVPHPQWLSRIVGHYSDPLVGGVGGFTVDNTGVRFQCRKTICDRFGNAYHVSSFFDERALNRPGSPFYPSLLGTNSTFRRSVLHEIGGFDHTFAYLLDETDVCLRIVDAGYRILYEPSALIFHQFASSHIRTTQRVAKTVYPSAISKSYFITRHGARQSPEEAGKQLNAYREEILRANQWLGDNNTITLEHRVSLDQDLLVGIKEGVEKAYTAGGRTKGHLEATSPSELKLVAPADCMRVALVSQGFPPRDEAGIARWTRLVAAELAQRGHTIHVICRANGAESTNFHEGYWIHAVNDDPVAGELLGTQHRLPPHVANRAAAVERTVQFIKTFGLDLVSFPIWDVEGIGCVSDRSIATMMSLHTTYSLAKPHKKEWSARPLFEHFGVLPVIAAENKLLKTMPTILANSRAIVADLTSASSVDFASRVSVVQHGTLDPLTENPERKVKRSLNGGPIEVLYVGRFETRKGFDIAARVFANVLHANLNVNIKVVGGEITSNVETWLKSIGAAQILSDSRVQFAGLVDRNTLDDLYAASDVVVMPSRYESFGLVAIEAMAAGTPVIASNIGGLAEVVGDGVSGRLVPLDGNEVASITEALTAIVQDSRLREKLREGARSTFEAHFTVKAMVDGIEQAMKQAIAKNKETSNGY